jgi:acetolactate synthase I/II/III large subunit
MKLSDFIIDSLAAEGVTHIFELCGGALAHMLNSLYGRNDIRTVSMHHEMAAAIAAEGYARVSGTIGVAMATSGPGATNLITGIGSCYFDSIPCLFITGQVNTYEYKFDKPVRQIGFQETDIVNIVRPITKKAMLLTIPEDAPEILRDAIGTARTGRPGPVLLDIPLDIQRADIKNPVMVSQKIDSNTEPVSDRMFNEIAEHIKNAERPVILAGGGVRSADATLQLKEFVHSTGIPVVTSLMGLDSYPHDDPLYVGMIGTYGNRFANLTIANADLLIALGTRLDTRQTGTLPETFARDAIKIHVDIDLNELNNKVRVDYPVNMNLKEFLENICTFDCIPKKILLMAWKERIGLYKKKYKIESSLDTDFINPYSFLSALSEILSRDAIICADVGQIQMWAAQTLNVREGQRFLTQGGMASIGSALPMAIGATFGQPDRTIVVITGDGGFQLNIQELETVFYHDLPIKIILLNNKGYGMIRQFQEQYFDGRFQSSVIGYSNPDFQAVVRAYKIKSHKIESQKEVKKALKWLFKDQKPSFLEIAIGESYRVIPKLAVNKPVEDQEPLLARDELRSQMIIDLEPR